ncbi:MAG: class I SAM-dependent methyltransferase [Gammaproteobacteria bacterium]
MSRYLVPTAVRNYLKRLLGIQFLLEQNEQLARRVTQLENKFYGSLDELQRDSKARWKNSRPDEILTWGRQIPGTAFVENARGHDLFGPEKSILEIGPGYGRLLIAMQQENVPFKDYLGVDLSANQVAYLSDKFANDRIHFLLGDAESFTPDQQFDSALSSLTFKHLFPSFKPAIDNISKYLKPGGRLCIDFIEGNRRLFEADGVTFVRHYTRAEITGILESAGFDEVLFDQVTHTEGFTRLLALARKPAGSAD